MNKMSIVAVMIAASVAGSAAVADREQGFFGGMFGGGHDGPRGEQMGGRDDGPDGPGGLLGGMLPDFAALDTDASGQITTEELDAAQAARFAAADANTDGGLSADEITAQIEARRAEMMAARAQRMIEEKDTNADGLLQAEEVQDARAPRTAVIFAMLDTNEDGAVDQAEFDAGLAMMAQHQGRGQRG